MRLQQQLASPPSTRFRILCITKTTLSHDTVTEVGSSSSSLCPPALASKCAWSDSKQQISPASILAHSGTLATAWRVKTAYQRLGTVVPVSSEGLHETAASILSTFQTGGPW